MPAPRRSSPPRTASRGRARGQTRQARSRTRTQTRSTRTNRRTKQKAGPPKKRGFWVKVVFMMLLGYGLVLAGDLLSSAGSSEIGKLWEKVVDRLLDNDVPRPTVDTEANARPSPRVEGPAPRVAPRAKGPPRADLPAGSPDDYARQSRALKKKTAKVASRPAPPPQVAGPSAAERGPSPRSELEPEKKAKAPPRADAPEVPADEASKESLEDILKRVTSEL